MKLLSRIFGRQKSPLPDPPSVPGLQLLYYREGLQSPLPPPEGRLYRVYWPDDMPPDVCLRHGLEAWLGMHAMRREGCSGCLQCAEPQQSLILEFYLGSHETREGRNDYIGAYWYRWHTAVPDKNGAVAWADQGDGRIVQGFLAYADPTPLMKSQHYLYEDGKIMSRWGNVTSGKPGQSYADQGVIQEPAGTASHCSLRLTQVPTGLASNAPPAVLLEWDPNEIRWSLAVELKSDLPVSTLWAYSPPYRLPNRWLQEHPESPNIPDGVPDFVYAFENSSGNIYLAYGKAIPGNHTIVCDATGVIEDGAGQEYMTRIAQGVSPRLPFHSNDLDFEADPMMNVVGSIENGQIRLAAKEEMGVSAQRFFGIV